MKDKVEGKKIPVLKLDCSSGSPVNIPADFKGHWTVLYFYPKDDTPGCTKQACGYRDSESQFKAAGAKIFGVSRDSLESHSKFINKYNLSFPLLSDSKEELGNALAVYSDGKTSRDTFLIDPHGEVRRVWRKVSPTETIEITLNELKSLLK